MLVFLIQSDCARCEVELKFPTLHNLDKWSLAPEGWGLEAKTDRLTFSCRMTWIWTLPFPFGSDMFRK